MPVTARAAADAEAGEDYGFLVLRRGDVVRQVPYAFLVTRPALARRRPSAAAASLQTRRHPQGRLPRGAPTAIPTRRSARAPSYTGAPMNEGGAEKLYRSASTTPVVNFGAAVIASSPELARSHPWVLGSPDENDVQGYAGTPVNVN